MDSIQKSNLIVFLQDMLRKKEDEHEEDKKLLTDIKNQLVEAVQALKESNSKQEKLEKTIADLQLQLAQIMAENSTLKYDNATLKARLEIKVGVPFMSYFKKVMNELKNGRTDYQNLLPATIQI